MKSVHVRLIGSVAGSAVYIDMIRMPSSISPVSLRPHPAKSFAQLDRVQGSTGRPVFPFVLIEEDGHPFRLHVKNVDARFRYGFHELLFLLGPFLWPTSH